MKARNRFEIIRFINSHRDWKRILGSPPYNLSIKEDGDYVILKYNQIFSDFNEQMVKEARGLILKKNGTKYKIVCAPFTKFFAYGDPRAREAANHLKRYKKWVLTEKIDGSLIKLFYDDDKWHIATNGTIDAFKAEISYSISNINNYGELFLKASEGKIDYDKLDKQYTYLFELVGLENRVIVPYKDKDVYYLGKRNNYTLKEVPYMEDDLSGIEMCKRPKCKIIDSKVQLKELKRQTDLLNENSEHFEGYVLSNWNCKYRIKIKSKYYLDLADFKGNGLISYKKALQMIFEEKDDDYIAAFPEYEQIFSQTKEALHNWALKIKEDLNYIGSKEWASKKDFAEWAKNTTYSAITFGAWGRDSVDDNWLENQIKQIQVEKLTKLIGLE